MPSEKDDQEGQNGVKPDLGRAAAASPWAGFASSGSGGVGVQTAGRVGARVAAIGIQRTAGQSLLAGIAQFFSTGTGMVAVAGLIGSASLFSLWNINHPTDNGDSFDAANQTLGDMSLKPGRHSAGSSEALRAPSGSGTDSLSYLTQANPGAASASDGGQPIGDAASNAQAASAALEAQQRANNMPPDNTNAPANVAANFPKSVGQMTTNLSGGGGSSSHGGFFGGGVASAAPATDAAHISAKAAAPSAGAYGASSAVPNTAPRTPVLGRSGIQRAGGGGAMGQLQASAAMSRGATMTASSEGQSYGASRAFEGTAALGSGGGAIGGTGTGMSASGGGLGQDTGGPVNLTNNSTAQQPQANTSGQNATPWQGEATMATILLAVAGLMLMAANMIPKTSPLGFLKQKLAIGAAITGGIVAAIGVHLMTQYSQTMQGGIFLAAGGLIGVLGAIAAIKEGDPKVANAPTQLQQGAIQQATADGHMGAIQSIEGTSTPNTFTLHFADGSTGQAVLGNNGAVQSITQGIPPSAPITSQPLPPPATH